MNPFASYHEVLLTLNIQKLLFVIRSALRVDFELGEFRQTCVKLNEYYHPVFLLLAYAMNHSYVLLVFINALSYFL